MPTYRGPFPAEVKGNFGGPFGSGIRNAPVPAIGYPKDMRDGYLFSMEFRQPIAEIERLAAATNPLRNEWPADAVAYTNYLVQQRKAHLYEHMGMQEACRSVSPAHLGGIIDTVRTRLLNLALALEKIAPDAGQRGAIPPSREAVQQIVTNVYGGSPNIAVTSAEFVQAQNLPSAGDVEALLTSLKGCRSGGTGPR